MDQKIFTKENKNSQLKGLKTISLRVCVMQILVEDCLEDPSTLFDDRGCHLSDENYPSNEINTCLSPKLKSAENVYDREERLTRSHKHLIHM